jgi:nitrogen regulatory protein PII
MSVVNVPAPKCRVELIVNHSQADEVVATIRAVTSAGCPGQVSDAKVMVMQLEEPTPAPKRERPSVRVYAVN